MNEKSFLFDTNVLSDLIRRPQGTLARKLTALPPLRLQTSIIVACELRYGALKKKSPRLQQKVDQLLELVEVLPLGPEADRHYGQIRTALEVRGEVIGQNDLLIAAHARALGLTLVTANVSEFSRVPGLAVENWLDPA